MKVIDDLKASVIKEGIEVWRLVLDNVFIDVFIAFFSINTQ